MTKPQDRSASGGQPKLNPGDEARPGTPGTGENLCPDCKGSGKIGAQPCRTCGGTGKVVEGVGGG
jgi:DnaJ-class molecular chaperone